MQPLKYSSWEGKEHPKSKNSMTGKKKKTTYLATLICRVGIIHTKITNRENIHTNIQKIYLYF